MMIYIFDLQAPPTQSCLRETYHGTQKKTKERNNNNNKKQTMKYTYYNVTFICNPLFMLWT